MRSRKLLADIIWYVLVHLPSMQTYCTTMVKLNVRKAVMSCFLCQYSVGYFWLHGPYVGMVCFGHTYLSLTAQNSSYISWQPKWILQACRWLDSAPTANVVVDRPRWSSPLVGPNISGLPGIQDDSWAILSKNSPNLPKFRCHGIVHVSIESAIPKNPLVGANISGLSVIQAELYVILCNCKFLE